MSEREDLKAHYFIPKIMWTCILHFDDIVSPLDICTRGLEQSYDDDGDDGDND